MKKNKQLEKEIGTLLANHYRQTLSDNIKRGIRARKIRLSTQKVDM
jgi:hypothetical protein